MIGSTLEVARGCCHLPPEPERWFVGIFTVFCFFSSIAVFLILWIAELVRRWRKKQ